MENAISYSFLIRLVSLYHPPSLFSNGVSIYDGFIHSLSTKPPLKARAFPAVFQEFSVPLSRPAFSRFLFSCITVSRTGFRTENSSLWVSSANTEAPYLDWFVLPLEVDDSPADFAREIPLSVSRFVAKRQMQDFATLKEHQHALKSCRRSDQRCS